MTQQDSTSTPKTLLSNLKDFFEMGAAELRKEWQTLTLEDKKRFVELFREAGIPCQDAQG